MSGHLAAFYRARLDDDEAAAKAAASESDGAVWEFADYESGVSPVSPGSVTPVAVGAYGFMDPAQGAHIARHDPARVLRDVEAGRALLADLQETEVCLDRGYTELTRGSQLTLLTQVRQRAAVYSDHPDYRPEWTL